MSDLPELDFEGLPAWARDALDATFAKPEQAQSVLAHREDDSWPLLLEAAVVGTFLPRDLAPEAVTSDRRADAEKRILGFAETTRSPDGVKWSLSQETRTEVLQTAIRTVELKEAIDRTSSKFHDGISQALRDCLTQGPPDAESLDLKALEATRIAVGTLSGVSGMDLPKLEDLDREIEFRRLISQFERMVGRSPDHSGPQTEDRFFGRDQEMVKLREYVGVIPAATLAGSAFRAFDRLKRKITGRAPMAVWGVGGAGKTTLISKFMLEHAEAAISRYPFAYLDFDRNTISARQRSRLLMEMCLQAGAQFKKLSAPMADLRTRVGQLARKLETTSEFESISFVTTYTQEFRRLVDEFLDSEESRFEWARPFLLVFDTFEVVQYAEDDVVFLQDFVEAFAHPQEGKMWSRMRLIISGRKQITNFLGKVEFIGKDEESPLGALDPEGSVAMVMALARDCGKPISESDAKTLVAGVAKATEEPGGGVQPLRLRLIGEVFKLEQMPDDGPAIVTSLVKELNEPLKAGGIAAQVLIDGILIRRVLGNVSDQRVRALADPGLVVRRITRGVVQEVMTRGTWNPAVGEPEDPDAEPLEPWIVDETEAKSIFDAFAKEVSLVESDGDALRHRPDVRRQMLPLIRARRQNRFHAIHQLAFAYFVARAERDPTDNASAAEAIYHGLWLNEPLTRLNALWRVSLFDPRIDPGEFDKGSEARIFLRAKVRAALSPNEVSKLPYELALDWLDARSKDLLDERRIEDAISAVRTAAGENYERLGDRVETAAVLARLLYRSGFWNESLQLASRYLDAATGDELRGPDEKEERGRKGEVESRRASVLSLLRTSATIEGKSGVPGPAVWRVVGLTPEIRDPLARIEAAAHSILASSRAGEAQRYQCEELKGLIRESVNSIASDRWEKEQHVLRLAILTTNGTMPELLDQWIELREKVSREIDVSTLTDALSLIFREHPAAAEIESLHKELRSSRKTEARNKVDELWRREKPTVMKALRTNANLKNSFWELLSFEHSDWVRPLGNALTHALKLVESGEALGDFLDKENFWDRKARSVQGRQRDGVGVVQSAADEGRLLELANALMKWKEKSLHKKSPEVTPSPYPQDVFDIGGALLRWHSTIVEDFRPMTSPL